MKRLIIACTAFVSIVTGFSSCGQSNLLPDGGVNICARGDLQPTATLCPDRASLGFATEFFSGTFIGQKPLETVSIRNNGLTNLEVASVVKAGDPAFTLKVAYDLLDGGKGETLPASIRGNDYLYLEVVFAPTQARAYAGAITVTSNAANAPTQVIGLSGCGVPNDGGTSPCYLDGGRP